MNNNNICNQCIKSILIGGIIEDNETEEELLNNTLEKKKERINKKTESELTKDDIIEKVYIENIFPSVKDLYKMIYKEHPEITMDDINNFYERQYEIQLTKSNHNPDILGHIVAFKPFETVQIDIFIMGKYEFKNTQSGNKWVCVNSHANKGYKYIFCMIDVFSRYAICISLKNKNEIDCIRAFKEILAITNKDFKTQPINIMSDSDASFLSNGFQKLLKDNNIGHDTSLVGDHNSLGIVDRFARTLKTKFMKIMLVNQNLKWVDYLKPVMNVYNTRPHRGIEDFTPLQALTDKECIEELLRFNIIKNNVNREIIPDLVIGDMVRINRRKQFEKGTEAKWSQDIYIVRGVNGKKISLEKHRDVLRKNLLKVVEPEKFIDDDNNEVIKINPIKEANKANKTHRLNAREGIELSNIIEGKRERKQVVR